MLTHTHTQTHTYTHIHTGHIRGPAHSVQQHADTHAHTQVTSEALRTLFNSALSVQFSHVLMAGMDPVINVNMHPEVRVVFVRAFVCVRWVVVGACVCVCG
jgi:hypothetical protein